MKKILTLLTLFCSFSTYAHDWEIAHPFADTKLIPKFNERYFREAFVRYRLEDDENTLVIDLHDQFLRAGSYSDYRVRCDGESTSLHQVTVDKKMLTRIFALFSELGIEKRVVDTHKVYRFVPVYKFDITWFENVDLKLDYGSWWMVDNFEWLDDTLEKVKLSHIVEAVSNRFPHISTVKFSVDVEDHPFQILKVEFDPVIEDWKSMFLAQAITLEY